MTRLVAAVVGALLVLIAWQQRVGAVPPTTASTTAPTPAPTTARSAIPAVSLTLDDATLPRHLGFYFIKAKGSIGCRNFNFAAGVFIPANFGKTTEPLPIVMALHNRGDSGSFAGTPIVREGLGMLLHSNWPDSRMTGEQPEYPLNLRKDAIFIGLVPQCPNGFDWASPGMPQFLCKLIDQISRAYKADDDRVYLTGFSYGASSAWRVAIAVPDRFAAVAPMDGRASPHPEQDVARLKDVAVYLSVGDTDGPFDAAADQMHEALSNLPHRNFVWNVVKHGNHYCYYSVVRNPRFWDWLLAQRRHRRPD